MTGENNDPFSATASALGYIYQCRYALYEALKRLRKNQEFTVSIEALDDVVFETNGCAEDLLQTKHHINKACNLTDASVELWKTIRIWCERLKNKEIDDGANLFLITTSNAAKGSASSYLRKDSQRDIEKAKQILNSIATKSSNATNKSAYTAFNKLSETEKNNLLNMIYVLDGSPNIESIDGKLKEVLFYAVKIDFLTSFIQRIEGWWFRKVINHLSSANQIPILDKELSAELDRLREQFKEDSLPVDDDLMVHTIDATGYKDYIFVKQLELINIGRTRILHAVRNYFRAAEQRSRWLREDLLLVGELDRYEDRLIEEWEIIFEQKKEELGEDAAEEQKIAIAKEIYVWVERNSHPFIRKGVREASIARGSYQILSNSQKVGWHLEWFRQSKNHPCKALLTAKKSPTSF